VATVSPALVALCHRRWALPILARLADGGGARFVSLQRSLAVSTQPLRDNLDALMAGGWLAPHAGYGHPLRPEYVLTKAGEPLALAAAGLLAAARESQLESLLQRKWTLPLLAVLAPGEARFAALAAALPGIGPRALTLALKRLVAARLLRRHVGIGHPPAVSYALAARGERLRPALDALLTALAAARP